jgi:hypothetical protein
VKKESAECPHNRDRRSCWQCEGASICEHNRILRQCKQCIEMLKDKRQKETKHKQEGFQDKGKGDAVEK